MSVFSQHVTQATPPPSTLVLPPSAFMPTWSDAPKAPICVGLTTLSEIDITGAKQAAATEARRLYPHPDDGDRRIDAMNDLIFRWIVARGTTDPNDVSQPFELWRTAPEDTVKQALTVEGCRAIFDAIERLAISTSPVTPEADDAEISALYSMAERGLERMPVWRARRVRRLLRFCLDEVMPFVPEAPADEAE